MQLKGRAALYWHHNAVMSSEKHNGEWSNLAKSSHILASGALVFIRVSSSVPQQHPGNQLAPLGNVAPGCLSGCADAFEQKLRLIWVVLMLLWVKLFIACQFVNVLLVVLLCYVIKRCSRSFWVWWWFTSCNSTFFYPILTRAVAKTVHNLFCLLLPFVILLTHTREDSLNTELITRCLWYI